MELLEFDCTSNCKLIEHGEKITKALTRHHVDEEKLIKYIILNCKNYPRVCDKHGRTALMMCCANAKPNVAEFLLNTGSNIHQKDIENNFTVLHRAIYYGWIDLAMILKRNGASFGSFDADFSTPLQLIPYSCQYSAETSAYVFGKNKNYNLGIGNVTSREYPDSLKSLPPIKQASINKFHSLFLSNEGRVYGCGVSKEGRVGIGSESTIVSPQEISIKFNYKHERIAMVSAGLHHSLILTHKSVYGCGSNKHFQLGLRNNEKALNFTEIGFDRTEVTVHKIHTVIACDYHSIFVSPQGVFVCGLNVGQFGGIQESIIYPRRLPHPLANQDLEIKWAQSNNCCICTSSYHKEISYFTIFYNRRVKMYKNPLMENIIQCAIGGGEMLYNSDEISKNSSQKPLTVTVMTEFNNLYIWYEDLSQFVKVHVSTLLSTQIREFATCGDGLLIEANGQLFNASFQHKVSKMHQIDSEFQEFHTKRDVAQFHCTKMSLKRVAHVANVNSFSCDVDGESFIVMMDHRNVKVPEYEREIYDFSPLLDDAQFEGSGIMDVTFSVKNEIFKANKFIVVSRCAFFKNYVDKSTASGICVIKDKRLTAEMFNCILTWIYCNKITGNDLDSITRHATDEDLVKKLVRDFYEISLEWDLNGIYNAIVTHFSNYIKRPEKINIKTFKWFNQDELPEFYDVTILLDENQQLRAHKVILMMRIEYFKMMFYHCWSENSTVDLRHISINFMRPIIQFAYDNNVQALRNASQSENFTYNMIAICDQYLIENMKTIFETLVCEKITLRNCAENLEFSEAYNCHLLKKFCMEFISLNLARLLEGNYLDSLDAAMLKELSLFYRKFFHFENDSNYIITPAFDAPTDEEIEEVIKGFDLPSYCDSVQRSAKKTPKIKNRPSKSELIKRNYEIEGVKELQKEIKDLTIEPLSPKSPDVTIIETKRENWQVKERERKDSAKKKLLTAVKCNEILKTETQLPEPTMIDLKKLKTIEKSPEPECSRNAIRLADFVVPSKKKSLSFSESPTQQVEPKLGWNMDNVELKIVNKNLSDPFRETKQQKKTGTVPKASTSAEKNFVSIIKNERKEKDNYEKIKSKSLILTQIEEKAIADLELFYNCDHTFDEDIKIARKVHVASQNLSQWHAGLN